MIVVFVPDLLYSIERAFDQNVISTYELYSGFSTIMSVQPELFSEIAYPLLIDITIPESHREPYSDGNLWLSERYDLEKIMEFSSTRNYIHSLKLRETFGRDLWCRFMNQMLKRLI